MLLELIAILTSGDRFRKATAEDYRLDLGLFFLIGVSAILVETFGNRLLDHANALTIWICATAAIAKMIANLPDESTSNSPARS